MNDVGDAPPPGFRVEYPDESFEMHVGPHYFHQEEDRLVGGFRAKTHHTNSSGFIHGGTLTAFADSVLTGVALAKFDMNQTWAPPSRYPASS